MTTPFDSSSPFADGLKSLSQPENKAVPQNQMPQQQTKQEDEFSIRTMHDDLLQSKTGVQIKPTPQIFETKIEPQKEKVIPEEVKIPTPAPLPVEKKELEIKAIPPLVEKTPAAETTTAPSHKVLMYVLIILVQLLVVLGGYYFWLNQKAKKVVSLQPQDTAAIEIKPSVEVSAPAPEAETPPAAEIPAEKYSTSKTNLLVLDIANMGSEEISAKISQIANEIKGSAATTPYEFTVVDANNNPVVFPIFVAAAKLTISQPTLSLLGTNFSLFIYNDNGVVHLGIGVASKNKLALTKELKLKEKNLATEMSFLYLDKASLIKSGTFADSTYGNFNIRYFNVSPENNFSLDYTITDTQFFAATSKMTLRAILDKNKANENISATPAPKTISSQVPAPTPDQAITPKPTSQPGQPALIK
jgi:flagellar basal body-associated protein FliL